MDAAIVKASSRCPRMRRASRSSPTPQNRIGVDNAVWRWRRHPRAHRSHREQLHNRRTDSFSNPNIPRSSPRSRSGPRSFPTQSQPPMWCNPASTNSRLSPPMAPHSFRHRRGFNCHLRHFARIRTDASRAVGQQILASLTTNPAGYFKPQTRDASKKGLDADLVVLDADPAADVSQPRQSCLHRSRRTNHLPEIASRFSNRLAFHVLREGA